MADHIDEMREYWSCPWIEAGIVFGSIGMHACCVGHHNDRGWVPLLMDFRGGKLPLEEVVESRKSIVAANQRPGHHPRCHGCKALEKRHWKKTGYKFHFLGISHFTRCNVRCYYCYVNKDRFQHVSEPYKLSPVLADMLREGHLSPAAVTHWGGGEPTILPEFNEMFSLLAEWGNFQYLNTNGVVLSRMVCDRLPMIGAQVTISVDSGTGRTYRRIKGVDAFDRVWRNLSEYAKAGGEKVVAKIVLTKHNYREVIKFVDKAEKAGVRSLLADVDAWETQLADAIVDAAALLAYQCKARGLRFHCTAPGSANFPEHRWEARVVEAYGRLVDSPPFSDKVKTWLTSPNKFRRLSRSLLARTGI